MRTRKHNRVVLAVMAVLALTPFFGLSVASAQTVSLAFSPDPASIYLNGSNSTVVDMQIFDGVLINAFDIILTYDASITRLTGWVNGGYLDISGGCLINVNNPGYFRLVCTQLNKPGVSGNGTLLKLTFSGTGYGSTPITFTKAELSNKASELVLPTTDNGQINTLYQAGTIVYSSLSGEVSLQGQDARGGIAVRLERGLFVQQGPYFATSLEQPGTNLFFNTVALDAYPITTAFPYYLNLDMSANKVKGLVGTSNTLSPLVLLGGNVFSSDNEINTDDLDLIKLWFDMNVAKIKPGTELLGDANNDGVVDIRDLALSGGNFGLNGTTAYAGWLP